MVPYSVGLDEYRRRVIERLRACTDPTRAQDLLVEVDVTLASSLMSSEAQLRFWQTLSQDLEVVAQECIRLLEKQAAATLAAVVAVAQAEITQYQLLLADESKRPTW